ncbi:LacI family DNA-binding transcriptional regulator [Microbacterium sp. SS28]|uniref:LacI family DNA-binding transcriptional regulator n=1 Tax=Microbacterium sp. SS28 TaxID=2919948 RepID=UPI001FAACCAF|nr:LacI family DNA-binding transcriptional regulator [Microbacterium sp. SS28]
MSTTTSEDVARLAGVSRGAVSQILNGRGQRFASETRDRVRRAAAELGYQPSQAGRTLAKGSSDIVLAVLPNTTFGGNLQDIFQTAAEDLATHGLTLLLHLATPTTAPLDRVITGMKPRAVVSLTPFTEEELTLLSERGVKSFDPVTTGSGPEADAGIGRLQARHLIDRGYKKLAFAHLRDSRQDPFGMDREDGVRQVCREGGLAEPASLQLGINSADALRAIKAIDRGTGIACYNDDVATALVSAASESGWRIPADVGIIGMDNTPLSAVTYPPLTTIGYDVKAAAHNLITMTLVGIGEPVDERPILEPAFSLIQRGTT